MFILRLFSKEIEEVYIRNLIPRNLFYLLPQYDEDNVGAGGFVKENCTMQIHAQYRIERTQTTVHTHAHTYVM